MNELGVLDTRFRAALHRMTLAGRIREVARPADPHLEIAAVMKHLDGGPALLFSAPRGHDIPVIGNLLCCQANCEAAFGVDYAGIRCLVDRAMGEPRVPELVSTAPVQEHVHRDAIDLEALLPALFHTPQDSGRFVTAGVVVVQDPDTGVHNASYHRLQLLGANRTAIKLDYGRHLRAAFERAKARGETLPVAVCIGADLAVQYAAAAMGSQMPESADELAAAGGLCGRGLPVVKTITQDIVVPAESEIVLEGTILTDETVREGPFGEFIGYLSPAGDAPVLEVTAMTHRSDPLYHVINGYGRETVMLRKYVLETSLLRGLRGAVPIVTDVEMTAGGLHRFHAVIQVRKQNRQHDGMQRNAVAAAFGVLKDLDLVTVVDHDIDIRDPADVEYAIATRFEGSTDLISIPGARGHEYVRIGRDGIRTKMGLDATVPYEERERFQRCRFARCEVSERDLADPAATLAKLGI